MKYKQLISLLLVFTIKLGDADRTKDRMYERIQGAAGCYRRMNATHQTGCSSDRPGSTGIVHLVETLDDLRAIVAKGTGSSYVPVMSVHLLTREVDLILRSSSKISGLLVYRENDTSLSSFSHESKCPNRNFALDGTCDVDWNEPGTDMMNEDFSFPMFYVTDAKDLDAVRGCYYRFNNVSAETHNDRSMCSVELASFMMAAIDTPTCLRRSAPFFNLNHVKLCDPLGSKNVWSTIFPVGNSTVHYSNTTLTNKVRGDMKYIIVAARLDSTSWFVDQVPGANNPVTGIVTLLYTAKLLKTLLPDYNDYDRNVMFLLLSGETYDYIGSQRIVYDMNQNRFPASDFSNAEESISAINLDDIHLIVELNQLSITDTLYVHSYEERNEMRDFISKLKKYAPKRLKVEESSRLPPSSLQTFIRNDTNVSGVVLTDHRSSYTNQFYNSMYDTAEAIGYEHYDNPDDIPEDSLQRHVASVANALARSLAEEVTKRAAGEVADDLRLVDELFECYLRNASCRVHQVVGRKKLKEEPMDFYVGVTASRSLLVSYIGLTLSWLTADVINQTGPCPELRSYVYKYYNMSKSLDDLNTTICYRSCMNFTEAVSPAFLIEDYDWSSNQYSSWTESVWKELGVRLFLRPAPAHENMTVAVGSLVMVMAFILVYFVSTRSHILFPTQESTSPARC